MTNKVATDLLKEVVCDGRCRGRTIDSKLGLESKLVVIAACNPLRKIDIIEGSLHCVL